MMMVSEPRKWQRLLIIASVLFVGALILLSFSPSSSPEGISHNNESDGESQSTFPRRKLVATPAECENTCKEPPIKDLQHFQQEDMMKPANVLKRLKKFRKQWVENNLKKDYGATNYQNIFEPMEELVDGQPPKRVSSGRNRIIKDVTNLPQYQKDKNKKKATETEEGATTEEEEGPPEHPAWDRFVQKMQMKILQVQLGILEERQNAKAICLDECGREDEQGSRTRRTSRILKPAPSTGLYSKFTWATGGHSASAGHGNLFRESYTAHMDRALTPILKAIGIDFEARNYAMGGTDCADEVALCMNQIFGRDIDAISWDYGMTDGHELWKISMYAYKAAGISRIPDGHSMPANIPHRPAFVALHQNNDHTWVVKTMHELGMTTLAWDGEYNNKVIRAAFPDMFGMTEAQIQSLPPYVQYYKCDGGIETGEPGCGKNKFNGTLCTTRKARTSWHPGWKDHGLVGNLMAMTILDVLEDALQGLMDINAKAADIPVDESPNDTKMRLLKQLRTMDAEEKQRYENIFNQPIPEDLQKHIHGWWKEERDAHLTDVDIEAFYKQTSFCHSAILPSEARFQGLVTENSTAVGRIEDQNYDEGVWYHTLQKTETPSWRDGTEPTTMVNPKGEGKLMLIRDDGGRQNCPEQLNLDYKDYFYVSSMEGWQTVMLPNDSERKVYTEFDGRKTKGYVLVCLVRCDWGHCPKGDLHNYFGWKRPKPRKGQEPPTPEELAAMGKVEIMINGESVTEASDLHTCLALKNKNGHVWKANAEGRYEVKIRVVGGTEYSYIRISAFVVL